MVCSMTGFGRSKQTTERMSVIVEMKSVNHRFCEISIRLPRQLVIFEDKIKKVISQYVQRGRVEVFITIEGEGWTKRKLHVDWQLLNDYYEQLKEAAARFMLKDGVTLEQLFQLEGVVEVVEEEVGNEEVEQLLLTATEEAAKQLKMMREEEGKALTRDIQEQLSVIAQCVQNVHQFAKEVAEQYRTRLMKRMNEWVQGAIDETRLLTEVAILAEKADINEELTRIRSHIEQVEHTLQRKEPVGRKLDFLVQELNREMNTIGAKANDGRIAVQVVEMKSALEKVKEQVQNIE
ncbi:MAG: YicC family protein [Anoxybacillus sp.]|nr:YicC/YloC family endoribonuclease [Anoxybacillus sp.]MCL6585774.1 YicC family protein [Anoxybacillus sp.]